MRISRFAFIAMMAAWTSACAVGPDFHRPDAPDVTSYDEAASLTTVNANDPHGATQTIVPGQTLTQQWWTLFQSRPLNSMITEALLRNPDLEAADAALRVAQEDLAAGQGYLFPTVSGNFSATREKTSGASSGGNFTGSTYTLYNASVNVSYGIDVFGGTRRQIEELEAARDYQNFQLQAARLSITSNVVTAAIQEASLRGQIAATKKLIEDEEKQVGITQKQLEFGGVTKLALLAQQTDLAQTRASIPGLENQLAQTRHALSTLVGQLPTHEPKATFELSGLHLPEKLPLTLPSQLVEQRPDIRAAEANLHAASAAIGVAEANRLPQFLLSGNIGSVANHIENLFTPGGGIWALGGNMAQTIFDAGTLEHKEGSARAAYDQAAALYRKTVLSAFQDVADVLRALDADAKVLQAQSEAERAASESLKLAQTQYQSGSISYLAIIDAQNAEQKAHIELVKAQAARYADTAALFQALGGGWIQKTEKDCTP